MYFVVFREEKPVIPKGSSTYEVVNGRNDQEHRKYANYKSKEEDLGMIMTFSCESFNFAGIEFN